MARPEYSAPQYTPQIDPQMLLYMYALKTQQAKSQSPQKPDLKGTATDIVKEVIGGKTGANLATTAGQNAIYNSGAMQAGGKIAASAAENAAYNSAATQAGSGLASQGIVANAAGMGALPIAAIGTGTYLGGKAALDMLKGKKPDLAGRVVLGMATGGLSEVANKIFGGHKSTRDRSKENTEDLLSKNKDDAKYQSYVSGMREQFNSAPPDPSKPFAGKYVTWDEYKKAGLEADNLTGVLGNLETFGKDWTNLDFEKRKQATQAIIDAGLYDSSKGEVRITDQNKAKEIFSSLNTKPVEPNRLATSENQIPVRPAGYDWNGKNFVKRKI